MINDTTIHDEKIELNRIKAKTFLEKNIPVHILKKDREWWNGNIIEVKSDFLIIDERKKGEAILFFLEIHSIEELEVEGE